MEPYNYIWFAFIFYKKYRGSFYSCHIYLFVGSFFNINKMNNYCTLLIILSILVLNIIRASSMSCIYSFYN